MPINPHFDSIEQPSQPLEPSTTAQLPGLIELAQAGEAAFCAKDLSCGKAKPGQVTAPEAFYLGDKTAHKCSELSGGVFDTSERQEQPYERTVEEVKALVIRESSLSDNSVANFCIEQNGTIKEIRDPHRKMSESDSAISIVMMDGKSADGGNAYTEKQKAALRQLITYVKSNWSENIQLDATTLDPTSPIRSAVFVETQIDSPWPTLPISENRQHFWEKYRWHLFDSTADEGRQCGEYDRVDKMTDEQKSQFIDRVKKLISRNEGGYSTIALNDNGYGISVGIAQWNQKKGELPKLFRAWYDASEAEKEEGGLPELYKGWRKAAEGEVQEKRTTEKVADGTYNRFERIFGIHAQTLLDEQSVRDYPFTADTDEARDMMTRLRDALDDKLFRNVQDELVRNNVRRAIILSDKYGHHSNRFVAQVADVANQYGWSGCESILRKANVANIPEDVEGECMALQAFIDNTPPKKNTKTGEPIYRTERDKRLDKEFPPKNASGLRLMTKYIF